MKGYKVFHSDWTCRGYQYEVGKTYEILENPKCCEKGFHFCKKIIDCFHYYSFDPANKIAEIEAIGKIDTDDTDSKCCTNKIIILKELEWREVLDMCNSGKLNSEIYNSEIIIVEIIIAGIIITEIIIVEIIIVEIIIPETATVEIIIVEIIIVEIIIAEIITADIITADIVIVDSIILEIIIVEIIIAEIITVDIVIPILLKLECLIM